MFTFWLRVLDHVYYTRCTENSAKWSAVIVSFPVDGSGPVMFAATETKVTSRSVFTAPGAGHTEQPVLTLRTPSSLSPAKQVGYSVL